jgi:hypothetical protein
MKLELELDLRAATPRRHRISSCARKHMLRIYNPKLSPPRRRGDGDAAPAAAGDTAVSASKCMLEGTTCAVHDTNKGGRKGHATNMIRTPLWTVRTQSVRLYCVHARHNCRNTELRRTALHVRRGDNWLPLLMHACDRNCYLRLPLCRTNRQMKFELKFAYLKGFCSHTPHTTP